MIALNRFDWEAAVNELRHGVAGVRRCGSTECSSCKCKSLDCSAKEQVLNLLAIDFNETQAPGGVITLAFSGGGMLRLEVECLEAEVADLGPVWQTACCPDHKTLDGEVARA